MFYVYAISSLSRNYIYVGMSSNLDDRIERHQQGREKTTRAYRPFELIYTEMVETR
ncbi:MAG: GIY-YIG nuclease family protein, partial [Gelidibacter sp.]